MMKVNIRGIYRDIMTCFFMACGLVLLAYFFTEIPFCRDECRKSVLSMMVWLFLVTMTYTLLFERSRWFYKIEIRSYEGEIPKAKLIKTDTDAYHHDKNNREVFAVHEAGHAVMGYINGKVCSVQILPSSARTETIVDGMSANALRKRILIDYAGAAAEEMMLGQISFGSMIEPMADFNVAVERIKAYLVMTDKSLSKSLLDIELSDKIIECSRVFYIEAFDILSERKKEVEIIAAALRDKDELSGDEIEALIVGAETK